jgi:membrane dipeptidase
LAVLGVAGLIGLTGAALSGHQEEQEAKVADRQRAAAIHERAILVDGHNDLPWRLRSEFDSDFDRFDLAARHDDGHTDIPRLSEGGVDAQFFAAYVPSEYTGRSPARVALEQIDLIRRMADRYPDLEMAYTADDVRRIADSGKIAVLVGIEGGHTIEGSLAVLRMFYALGARYMTLTHASTSDWADAATDEARHGGLSEFGEQVVREMNRLGMLVDISHVSAETMDDVLRVSRAPVVASHSGARAINDHPRNVPDSVLRRIAENGGVVMVNFYSGFVVPEAADIVREMFDVVRELRARYGDDDAAVDSAWRAWSAEHPIPRGTVGDLVDHIDHIVRLAGIDNVGLGSDFDGISVSPEGLEDVSRFPAITEELLRRGYGEEEVAKVLGGNVLRAMAEAERVARRLAAAP